MADAGTREAFLRDLAHVIGQHGYPEEPPDDAPPAVEFDGAEQMEMAEWLRHAADYCEIYGWAETIDSHFGTKEVEDG